jgi:hypothetical protein
MSDYKTTQARYLQHQFTGVPFIYFPETNYYQITYYHIAYTMPQSLAAKLAEYWRKHTKGKGFNVPSVADVKRWFDQLPAKDQQFVVRYDLDIQQYI